MTTDPCKEENGVLVIKSKRANQLNNYSVSLTLSCFIGRGEGGGVFVYLYVFISYTRLSGIRRNHTDKSET